MMSGKTGNEVLDLNTTTSVKLQTKTIAAFMFDPTTKRLSVLDQTLLPKCVQYVDVCDSKDGHSVIKDMKVRGAPGIAAVGCLSIMTELYHYQHEHLASQSSDRERNDDVLDLFDQKSKSILTARPTAVNLKNALEKLYEFGKKHHRLVARDSLSPTNQQQINESLIDKMIGFCLDAIKGGQALNKRLGDYGAEEVIKLSNRDNGEVVVLTHCNTGTLATVGYGTALGVIRSLRNMGRLHKVYCTETRPYNQGSRLTAWELVQEKMPATLIADSMVAYLMANETIDAILVGADCVAANGDTANKIGTLQLAVLANHYNVPFYVAAPTQSLDLSIENQSGIEIEQRPAEEMRRIGNVVLAPDQIDVWNPCFDVTPANLISGIITEYGVCKTNEIREFLERYVKSHQMESEETYALF